LLNWFYRVSVKGERDRDTEDEARTFFAQHGHWPDEEPPAGAAGPGAAKRPGPPAHRPSAPGARPPSTRRGHRPKP
jgi:hypothetical protein